MHNATLFAGIKLVDIEDHIQTAGRPAHKIEVATFCQKGGDTMKMNGLDWLAMILIVIGGLNWGLVGLFDFDLVALIFGDMSSFSRLVYIVVGVSAIYMIIEALVKSGKQTPTTPTHA